jgi:hypothetical protein
MIFRKILPYQTVLVIWLLISIACGQDWLGGGYVGSYDGDIAQYFTDPTLYSNPTWGAYQQGWQPYQFRSGFYPGPYGVFPYDLEPYYSDFRLNSLAGMNWKPFQPNWSETMDYARTNHPLGCIQDLAIRIRPFNLLVLHIQPRNLPLQPQVILQLQ